MKREVIMLGIALLASCGSRNTETTSCEVVAQRLVELKVGNMASFMTDDERASRARRWIARCESMTEATRRCVLAATTTAEADACSRVKRAGVEGPTAKAEWILRAGDASPQAAVFVAFAADGDVIAAGDFNGNLELGGQVLTAQRTDVWVARLSPTGTVRWAKRFGGTGRDYVEALRHDDLGRIVIGVQGNEAPHFSRVTFAADGVPTSTPIPAERPIHAVALHANGDIVVGGTVIERVKGSPCNAMNFVVQRFAADGKHLWSRCNDGKAAVTLTGDPVQIAAGLSGMTAVCGGFSGALAWAGKAAPAGGPNERSFVVTLDAKGETRWAIYLGSERDVVCDALAVSDDGSVLAVVRGTTPGSALAVWETDGTQRWMRSCQELLGTSDKCLLSALTMSGSDVVIAAWDSEHNLFATIDSKTGARKQASTFAGGLPIEGIAVRDGALVFATRLYGTIDFGTGPVEATRGGDSVSVDALIGRL